MKNIGFFIGLLIIIAVIIAGYFYFRQYRLNAPSPLAENLPVTANEETTLEKQVGVTLPEGVEKSKLVGVSGGAATGIATREYKMGRYELNLIASLPDLTLANFYQGWLVKGEEVISLGNLEEKKGGWALVFSQDKDLTSYNQVLVSLEEKADNRPEKKILEGGF